MSENTFDIYFQNFINFINNIEFFFKFIVIYLSILYIVVILRVMKDIVTRTNSILYQFFCIVLILLTAPIGGIFLYLLFRPSRTLNEKYYDEIEQNLDIMEKIIKEHKQKNIVCEKKLFEKINIREGIDGIKEKEETKIELRNF